MLLLLRLRDYHVPRVELDVVYSARNVRRDSEDIVAIAHEKVQHALRNVDRYPYIDVHEPRLDHEEHGLAGMQRGRFTFAFV